MTRLSVWYVYTLFSRGEVDPSGLVSALQTRVNLFRLTDLWTGENDGDVGQACPEWQRITAQIAEWIESVAYNSFQTIEERTCALLAPLLEARIPKDVGPPPVRPFACWTYELGWPGLADRPGWLGKLQNRAHLSAALRRSLSLPPLPSREGVLHFMNVVVPRSPFEDMPALARSLHSLIQQVQREQPQVRRLWCNTWLNDHPRFHALFPATWFASATLAPSGHYRNWWGQFAGRDGSLNERLVQQFRASGGQFPFRALQCHASLEDIQAHLEAHVMDING